MDMEVLFMFTLYFFIVLFIIDDNIFLTLINDNLFILPIIDDSGGLESLPDLVKLFLALLNFFFEHFVPLVLYFV